jgi:hypothetical protein
MSTYGRKALIYWDYEGKNTPEEFQRFLKTTHNIQEEILKKWYPIGMTCEKTSKGSDKYYGSYVVTGYIKYPYGWRLNITDNKNMFTTTSIHSANVRPDEQWIRDKKLEKLGI